jgi:hypothetical protein
MIIFKKFNLNLFVTKPCPLRDDAKWKIKENEWYLYGFDAVKIKIKIKCDQTLFVYKSCWENWSQ